MENGQIAMILEYEGLNASQLAERLGVQRALISHLQNNRNRVTMDIVKKIHHAFPHISLAWLIDCEGDYQASATSLSAMSPAKDSDSQLPSATTEEGPQESVPEGVRSLFDGVKPVFAASKSTRKVMEIKVFYDDGTYETFISTSR